MTRQGPFASIDRFLAKASTRAPRAALLAGDRLLRQGRRGDAEALLELAVASFPRHAGIAARWAAIAQDDGRYAVAVERWHVVCALRPADFEAWRRLAESAHTNAELSIAAEAASRAYALRPNDRGVLVEVAHAHDCAGRHDLAEPICRTSRHACPATRWAARATPIA